jgi:hypothetical protein
MEIVFTKFGLVRKKEELLVFFHLENPDFTFQLDRSITLLWCRKVFAWFWRVIIYSRRKEMNALCTSYCMCHREGSYGSTGELKNERVTSKWPATNEWRTSGMLLQHCVYRLSPSCDGVAPHQDWKFLTEAGGNESYLAAVQFVDVEVQNNTQQKRGSHSTSSGLWSHLVI